MSRHVAVTFRDDLAPERPADVTRTLALDDKIVELDLSEASSAVLDEMLAKLMAAGRAADALHRPRPLIDVMKESDAVSKRRYLSRMRAWAETQGRESEVTRNTTGDGRLSSYAYSPELERDFAAYARGEGLIL